MYTRAVKLSVPNNNIIKYTLWIFTLYVTILTSFQGNGPYIWSCIRNGIRWIILFSSVQFNMVSMCLEKPIYAPPCLRSFPNIVCMIDGGPLSSFQGRSFSISSFHTSLLQAVSGMMSLALCLQVVSQVSQHFRARMHGSKVDALPPR